MTFRESVLITAILFVSIVVKLDDANAYEAITWLMYVALAIVVWHTIIFIKPHLFYFYKWINYPLRSYYESRERNYKDVISTLEKQLFEQKRKDAINEYHHSKANVNNFKNEEHKNRTHVNEL